MKSAADGRVFRRKHGINAEQARDLIKRIGNNREELDAAAEKLKS